MKQIAIALMDAQLCDLVLSKLEGYLAKQLPSEQWPQSVPSVSQFRTSPINSWRLSPVNRSVLT
jgi:hypothetical protein